jgi:hypothetical protein
MYVFIVSSSLNIHKQRDITDVRKKCCMLSHRMIPKKRFRGETDYLPEARQSTVTHACVITWVLLCCTYAFSIFLWRGHVTSPPRILNTFWLKVTSTVRYRIPIGLADFSSESYMHEVDMHCTVLFCTVLFCTVLCCTVYSIHCSPCV